jgi:hypothetical protein
MQRGIRDMAGAMECVIRSLNAQDRVGNNALLGGSSRGTTRS